MTEINNIRDRVKKIMENYPECRNYDKQLIWQYWIEEGCASRGGMAASQWENATSPMTISRARRDIQKGGELLPTRVDIVKERRYNRKRWEKAFKSPSQKELF